MPPKHRLIEGQTVFKTSVVATSSGTAYAAGDLIGGKLTFSSAVRVTSGTALLHSVVLADNDKQNVSIDLLLFRKDPASTTFTDNSALDVADSDLRNLVGHVSIDAGDYTSLNDNSLATVPAVNLPVQVVSAQTLYGCLVSRGTPTYTTSSGLQVMLGLLQD